MRSTTKFRDVLKAQTNSLPLAGNNNNFLAVVASVLLESEGRVTGDTLTATEQRVAELIGSGASNRGAADALFISVRTVETHVAAIYRKLGVRSRAELAKWLADTPAD